MRNKFKDLGTVDTQENGLPAEISDLKAGTVGVTVDVSTSPAWSGTWVLQISNDGSTFVQAPTSSGGVTATGTGAKSYPLEVAAKQVRLVCTSYSAGLASAYLGGEELPAE